MRSAGILASLAIVVAACGAGGTGDGGPAPSADEWRTAVLTDARTGESFSVDDLVGKVVVIEPMAIWCVNCQFQQGEVAVALDRLDDPALVYISLDVDPNEEPDALARYADERGWSWHYVVASRDVARSLAAEFGDQVLSPPSTPMILIGPDGAIVEQHIGIRGSDELIDAFERYLP